MERRLFISRNIRSAARACAFLSVVLISAASIGCELLPKCICGPASDPHVAITRVDTLWQQEVCVTENTRDGKPVPGILGRVWLYTANGKAPVEAPGGIAVWMHDLTPTESGKEPVALASWGFNPKELDQLKRKDMVGIGYSLFLPLEIYRPDMKQVRITLAFVDEKGNRTAAPPDVLILRVDERVIRMQTDNNKQLVPAAVK